MVDSIPPSSAVPQDPEDAARAGFYGLIGRLFYNAPDPNLIAEICQGAGGGGEAAAANELVLAWRDLQGACKSVFPPVVRQEFDTLFVGVGKAEVTPYLSGYAREISPDRYLVQLRERLAGWGLARRPQAAEVEDHFSGLCDVMRWLIESGQSINVQADFYRTFVDRSAIAFFAAVQDSPTAHFYKLVVRLASAFFEVERAAFEVAESE